MEIQIIVPAVSDEPLADMLRAITEAISHRDDDEVAHGILGGEFGYGGYWDSTIFLMHPYCWCELETCKWCSKAACGCPDSELEHYWDGTLVSGDEAWRLSEKLLGRPPHEVAKFGSKKYETYRAEWEKRVAERDARSKTIFPARCHCCEPSGLMADRPRGESCQPNQTAPNFWHKASGLKVWWYKYIGRSMETLNCPADLTGIMRDCLSNIQSAPTPPPPK